MDDEDSDDESNWEMNLNDNDAIMENNEKDGETCSEVVNNNEIDCDDGDEVVNDTNVSDSNESDTSDYETFHDQMDWDHVLHTHGSCRKKGIAAPAVLDERIEEYVLQGIAEEFNPTFNEDVIATETLTNINIGNVAVPLEESMHQFPEIDNAKVGQVIDAPISHFNFQRHFSAEEYFMVKLCNICDKANVPHHVIDDIVNLLRECDETNIKFELGY